MIVVPGEILLDVFPDYRRIGGAPFNFAYHLHQLGLPVRFVSRVGRDADGEYIRVRLKKLQFDDRFIQIDERHPTGRVNVVMEDDGSHQFEILPDTAYDHIVLADIFPGLPKADAPKNDQSRSNNRVDMIYFGTLVQRTPESFSRMREFLANRPPWTRTFCDINLRPVSYPDGVVTSSLEQADILKLNDHELDYLRDFLQQPRRETDAFAFWLMDSYEIEAIALTLGKEGSRIYTDRGVHKTAGAKPRRVVDTVGAGDAYAAVLAFGWLNRWPVEKILSTASQFAADICGISGAVPEERKFYHPIRHENDAIGDEEEKRKYEKFKK
jgi:fructokinase